MASNLRRGGPLESLITAPEEGPSNQEILAREADYIPGAAAEAGTIGDFKGGLRAGARGVQAGEMFRAADQAELDGDLEAAEILRQQGHNFNAQGAQHAPRVQSLADVNDIDDALDFAQGALGQLAPTMAATTAPALVGGTLGGIIGGPIGAAAGAAAFGAVPGYQMEAGEAASSQQADEFIRANTTAEQRLIEQRRKGAQGAAIELIFPTVVGGRLANSVGKIFTKISKEGTEEAAQKLAKQGKTLKNQGRANIAQEGTTEVAPSIFSEIAKETAIEGATEGAQTFIGQASLSRLNPNRDRSHDVQEIIDSVVMGALGGGGISLSTTVPGAMHRTYRDYRDAAEAKGLEEGAEGRVKQPINVPDATLDAQAVGDAPESAVNVPESRLDEDAQAEAAVPDQQPTRSDADLEREARVKKSVMVGTILPDDARTHEEPSAKKTDADPEEIMQLREFRPVSKNEPKGQRRYVRANEMETKAFLQKQVDRGVITQEVADSATVEPLGTRLKRKGASIEELENEIASISRDLMQRIEANKKSGNLDMVKALTSELANLPVDVQRRGERTGVTESEVVLEEGKREQRVPAEGKQRDLFPETLNKKIEVPFSEFRRNHFGKAIVPARPTQQELAVDNGTGYKDLLVRALDQYNSVLASDAAVPAQAATEAQTKSRRKALDTQTKQQREDAGRREVKFRLKNGQTRKLDMDDMIQQELAAGREGELAVNLRGTKQEREAALQSAIASELLREDVAGVLDANGKVMEGSKVPDLLGDRVLDAAETVENKKAETKVRNREQERALRQETGIGPKFLNTHPYVMGLLKDAARDKNTIQRKYNAAVKEAGGERDAKGRKTLYEGIEAEAKRINDVLKQVGKLSKEASYMDRVNALLGEKPSKAEKSAAYKKVDQALTQTYGKEVATLMKTFPQRSVAKFRADRLTALAEHLREIERAEKADQLQETGEKRTKGGKTETLEAERGELAVEQAQAKAEKQVRHAEDHTGADRALKVGTPFRGKNKTKKVFLSDKAEVQTLETLAENSDGKVVVHGPLAGNTLVGENGKVKKAEVLPIARFANEERVPVLVAKADLDGFANSRTIDELTGRGMEVVMTNTSPKVTEAFEAKGYRAFHQPGGVVYAPTVGHANFSRRFNRQSVADPELQNAINQKTRKARQNRIIDYVEKVLGDRVEVLFKDIQPGDNEAGYFDWKKKTIGLALNLSNAEGVARHEAFHAWFQALGKIDKNRAIYNRLLKAANAPHIRRQLAKLLENHPDALKQLRDPEERLAYMFQFYATGQLNLQPQTFKTFRRWGKALGKLIGYVGRMDSAQDIFEAFNDGNLKTDAQIAEMIKEQQHTKLAADISAVLRPVDQAMRAVLTTATNRLRATNNQSLTRLADLFAHTVKSGGVVGYLSMRAQKEAQFNNMFNDTIAKHTKNMKSKERDAEIKKALKELQSMKPTSPLAKDIRKQLDAMHKYLRDPEGDTKRDAIEYEDADGNMHRASKNAVMYITGFAKDEDGNPDYGKPIWEPIKHVDNYFPRVWDPEMILNDWDSFAKLLREEGGMQEADINSFRKAMEAGDGMLDMSTQNPTFDAAMKAVNDRKFDFITPDNANKFAKFQAQDMTKILTTYARQAAHRGEQTRHFGYDNQTIKSLLKDAKDEGATKQELEMADKAIKALEGTLGHETMTPLKKNAMMTGMTIVNLSALPLALFSSLVDPLGVAVRTGDFKAAGKTFITATRQMMEDIRGLDDSQSLAELTASVALAPDEKSFKKREARLKRAQAMKMAKFLGIVEQEQVLSVIGDSYNSMFANEQLQKINTRFFKMIGLDSWTKGTRIGAMVAAMEYLNEYQNDEKRLAELGLEKGDIEITRDGQVEIMPAKLGQEKARRVQGAIYRMVDESILRPNAAQRPIFMSDMRFMLLGHLKQFTFSFHNTIIKQVAQNINDNIDNQEYVKAMTQLIPLISYVPFMMAADVLRSVVGGRIDDEDDETFGEVLSDSIQRAGVLGVGTFAMDAADDISYGGAPINTFLGPVIHKGARLVEAGIDPDESFSRQAVRLLPGYAFWKGWLE